MFKNKNRIENEKLAKHGKKRCIKCKKIQDLSQYNSYPSNFDGLNHKCKKCLKQYKKEYFQKNKEKITIKNKAYKIKNKEKLRKYFYNKGKEYKRKNPWASSHSHAKQRCTNANNDKYEYYGGRGIQFLLTMDDFKFLWFRDKAYEMKQPSIDRIDNDGNYILGNCQFIERIENHLKNKRKPILQFDKQGNFIQEWESIAEIVNTLKYSRSNISSCCSGKTKRAYGFIWRYKE